MSAPHPSRLAFVDLLRALAASTIVWHHLAFYGPLSDVAHPLAPGLLDWLDSYGRMAVQVFLVLGGFMMGRSLDLARPLSIPALARPLGRR
jgi:peptidoglycan/LPS O-acetylase OafA/YrhL